MWKFSNFLSSKGISFGGDVVIVVFLYLQHVQFLAVLLACEISPVASRPMLFFSLLYVEFISESPFFFYLRLIVYQLTFYYCNTFPVALVYSNKVFIMIPQLFTWCSFFIACSE